MAERRRTPLPSTDYGSADEETNRLFRKLGKTREGTRIGIPGRSDSSQNSTGKWQPWRPPRTSSTDRENLRPDGTRWRR
jgi:hypothetical protein